MRLDDLRDAYNPSWQDAVREIATALAIQTLNRDRLSCGTGLRGLS